MFPDAFDLRKKALTGLKCILSNLDEEQNYRPFFWILFGENPVALQHDWADFGDVTSRYVKAVLYEGVILGLYGLEGEHWNYNDESMLEVSQEFLERTNGDWNLGAHEGVGYYAGLGLNLGIVKDIVAPTPTDKRPDIIESRKNLKGTIFPANAPQDLVPPGPVENKKMPAIRQAWNDLIIKATLASSEEECREIISTFADTWKNLGGDDVITEKNELVD